MPYFSSGSTGSDEYADVDLRGVEWQPRCEGGLPNKHADVRMTNIQRKPRDQYARSDEGLCAAFMCWYWQLHQCIRATLQNPYETAQRGTFYFRCSPRAAESVSAQTASFFSPGVQ